MGRRPYVRLGWPDERPASREEAEFRVLHALATERRPGLIKSPNIGMKGWWPEIVYDEEEIAEQARMRKQHLDAIAHLDVFLPDRRDLSDWDTAILWWARINPCPRWDRRSNEMVTTREQEIVRWRSIGLQSIQPSWEYIADVYRASEYAIRQDYDHAVDNIWRVCRALPLRKHRVQSARRRAIA